MIRFRLDRDATVRVVRRRIGGHGGSRPVRDASGPAEAGVTKLRVRSARLGAPGRYRLVVRPRAAGGPGEPARARYRVAAG